MVLQGYATTVVCVRLSSYKLPLVKAVGGCLPGLTSLRQPAWLAVRFRVQDGVGFGCDDGTDAVSVEGGRFGEDVAHCSSAALRKAASIGASTHPQQQRVLHCCDLVRAARISS